MYEKNIKDKKDKNYDKRDEKKSFVFVVVINKNI